MTGAPPYPHGDPDAVVRRVLADPAYRHAGQTTSEAPHESLLSIVLHWLFDHLIAPLIHPISRALAASSGVGTFVGFAFVAVALALLAYVAFRLAVAFAAPAVAARAGSLAARGLAIELGSADWRAAARDAAARGAYADAIAALFRAALAALDEHAIVAFDAARTPGEYRRAVRRARAAAAAPFDDLADGFVRAAFAGGTPQRAEFDAAERAFAAFEPALGT